MRREESIQLPRALPVLLAIEKRGRGDQATLLPFVEGHLPSVD
jgi:hypothetical protein